MHCLLCHEKIPRLRAWTGKSEFCCDEHADLYKKQTMDRLLVDDSESKSAAPALPIFENDATAVDHILLKDQPKKGKQAKEANETGEVDELWKLAERMGGQQQKPRAGILLPGVSGESQANALDQSADEALAALQALAAEAAQSKQDAPAEGDLLDELSNLESSLDELPQLDSLPTDLAADWDDGELDEAPELELDAFEPAEAKAESSPKPELVAQAAALDSIDAPDLVLEGLQEAQAEAIEPPELAAQFEDEQEASLEPPDVVLEELLAASAVSDEQGSDLSDPPEPADFNLAASHEADVARPAPVPAVVRRAPKAAPKLRPATELQEMSPSPNLPEGGYALKPWTEALAIAGPDRSSLLSPTKFLELRKSSLNGTASAKFDPVQFQPSKRIASVPVPISEPSGPALSYESDADALTPSSHFAWPAPLHAALTAAEMRLVGMSDGASLSESSFSVRQPPLSDQFLSRVAIQSRVLEPRRSAILSPPERDVFTSAAAEEEESGSEYASASGGSDRDETDGGERVHVADLF